ncbi:hypothetical protein GCM10022252_78560 [Streptosporangium oxazolinicum]|uniref:Uncharacterized protein n=1 Tax=Streptosporangium oxazolinicum TaxID=909287 RepID=A0ABP8BMM5_9ACTN
MRLLGSIVKVLGVLERVSAFVFGGAELAVGGVTAARVVEALDVTEQDPFGF